MIARVFVSFVDLCHFVNKRLFSSRQAPVAEKMRKITFSIWLLWLIIFDINGQLTLESVAQKVNDMEVEVNTLKVTDNFGRDLWTNIKLF